MDDRVNPIPSGQKRWKLLGGKQILYAPLRNIAPFQVVVPDGVDNDDVLTAPIEFGCDVRSDETGSAGDDVNGPNSLS